MGRGLGVSAGLGVGEGLGVEVGVAVGVAVASLLAVAVAVGVGVAVGVAVAVAVGVNVAVAVGVGVDVAQVSVYCWLSLVGVPGAELPGDGVEGLPGRRASEIIAGLYHFGRLFQVLVAGSQAITLVLMAKLTSPPASSHLPL